MVPRVLRAGAVRCRLYPAARVCVGVHADAGRASRRVAAASGYRIRKQSKVSEPRIYHQHADHANGAHATAAAGQAMATASDTNGATPARLSTAAPRAAPSEHWCGDERVHLNGALPQRGCCRQSFQPSFSPWVVANARQTRLLHYVRRATNPRRSPHSRARTFARAPSCAVHMLLRGVRMVAERRARRQRGHGPGG